MEIYISKRSFLVNLQIDLVIYCYSMIVSYRLPLPQKYFLKVMKPAASSKHRPPVKTIQCEKKLSNSHLHSSEVRKMC